MSFFNNFAGQLEQKLGQQLQGQGLQQPHQQQGGYQSYSSASSTHYQQTTTTTHQQQGGYQQTTTTQQYSYQQSGGRYKALLIGINYIGGKSPLNGCINDVQNVRNWLLHRNPAYGQNMLVLTDDQQDPSKIPTRANMLNAFRWLAADARPGDHLFFHYSGHGATQKNTNGTEADGTDETLVPVDYERAGQIVDDDVHAILCKPLPQGCNLVAFMDCCHSGTVFDLPYTYGVDGNLDITIRDNKAEAVKHGTKAVFALLQKNHGVAFQEATQALKLFLSPEQGSTDSAALDAARQQCTTRATIVQFSGCRDDQTSADAQIQGQATGALSWALMTVLQRNPNPTYAELLRETRGLLQGKYSQVPQMSTGFQMDVANGRFQV
ncbi:caspase domain-containing protein [Polychytrium aggregatum]|uniref:caspase domain-containing protein n=1 Tax=Polychytrium aggregatum TaxID=110093 RepID=UPI0022FDF04F|nr:caspase domain-containing protein [Polychytrium aggregatum]KAI9204858.1 caspase domain-containing protein [Polychytrium aggregatum]